MIWFPVVTRKECFPWWKSEVKKQWKVLDKLFLDKDDHTGVKVIVSGSIFPFTVWLLLRCIVHMTVLLGVGYSRWIRKRSDCSSGALRDNHNLIIAVPEGRVLISVPGTEFSTVTNQAGHPFKTVKIGIWNDENEVSTFVLSQTSWQLCKASA